MSNSKQLENHFFTKAAEFAIRFRWLVLVGSVGILVSMLGLIHSSLRIDTGIESFSEQGSDAQKVLDEYRDEFGRDGMYAVVIEGDVYTPSFFKKLAELHRDILGLNMELESIGAVEPNTVDRQSDSTVSTERKADSFGFDDDDDDEGFDDESTFEADSTSDLSVRSFEVGNVAKRVTSLINARRTFTDDKGSLVVGRVAEPYPRTSADFIALKKTASAERSIIGRLVGAGGRHAVIALQTHVVTEVDSSAIHQKLESIVTAYADEGFQPLVGGTPGLNASLNRLLMSDLSRMLQLSVLIMLFILTYLFRHPIAVIAPLYVVGFSAVVMVGTLAAMDIALTMMSNILPAFLFCVGIGHSVHLISVYRDIRAGQVGLDDTVRTHTALVEALATTGVPIFFTSITTMVGLLSFRFASITAIQEMGVAGAYAVGIAFIASCTILPALLSFHRRGDLGRVAPSRRDFIDRFLNFCIASSGLADDDGYGVEPPLARRRRRRLLVINVILVVVMLVAALQLKVWHNPLSWIPEEQPIRKAFDALDEHVGGTANVQLLVRGKAGSGLGTGMRDLELLKALEHIESDITAYEHPEMGQIVGSSVSILNVVKESHQALTSSQPKDYRLPENNRGIADMLFMFENAGPDEMAQLATGDLAVSQMTIQIKWLEASQFRALTPYIDNSIQTHAPDGVSIKPTGAVYTLVSTIANLIWDLLFSFGMAFAVITVLMIVLLGGFKLGLIAMVPNLMPVIVIMGVMHLSGIPIDMNNILIASISMGLAVDDTIHFLHHFRMNHLATGNVEVSIRNAMMHSGRAMVSTTLILMLGFFVYMGAEMANIQRFGLLIGLTALFALLIDLFFAPALLRTFYKRAERPN